MKIPSLLLISLLSTTALAQHAPTKAPAEAMKLPKEYKSAGGMIEAQVIKIYSAKSPSGAEYCSYVIKWNNSEVVVANMFSSDKESKDIKVDDTIQVMAHEIEMSISGEKMHILQFMFLGAVDDKGAEEK